MANKSVVKPWWRMAELGFHTSFYILHFGLKVAHPKSREKDN